MANKNSLLSIPPPEMKALESLIPEKKPKWLIRAMDPATSTTKANETVRTKSGYSEDLGGEVLVPTIRMGKKGLYKPDNPFKEAIAKKDYILVKGPKGPKTAARATSLSRYISDVLITNARKNFQSGGLNMARTKEATYDDTEDQMNMMGFDPSEESIDPVSGNEVPLGGTPEGVRDNIDVKMSPGEMVIPEYAVNYHGVETYINSIQKAQQGYEQMQDMGLMGNPDEAIMDESEPLPKMKSEEVPEYQTGGLASFGDLSSVAVPQLPTSAVAVPQSATANTPDLATASLAQPLRPTSTQATPIAPKYPRGYFIAVPESTDAYTFVSPPGSPIYTDTYTREQVGASDIAPLGTTPESIYGGTAPVYSAIPALSTSFFTQPTTDTSTNTQVTQPQVTQPQVTQPQVTQPQVAPSIGGGQGSAASASAPSGTASAAPAPSAQASAQAAAQAGLASTTAPGLAAISGLAADTTAAITKSTHAAHTQTPMQAAFSTLSLNDPSVDVVGKTISATDVASEVAKMALNSILPTVIPLPLSNVLNPISMVTGIANSIANHASQPQMAVDQAARGVPNTGVHSATGYSFHAVPSLLGNLLGLDAIAVYNENDPTAAPESVDVALANMARSDNIDVSYYSNSELRSLYGLIDENGLRANNIPELTPAEGAAHGMPTSEGSYLSDGSFMSKDGVHSATGTFKAFSELSTLDKAVVAVMRDKNDPFSFLTNIDMDDPANFSSLEAQTESNALAKSLIGNINLVSNTHPNLDLITADQLAVHKTIEQHNYVVNKDKIATQTKQQMQQHQDRTDNMSKLSKTTEDTPTVTTPELDKSITVTDLLSDPISDANFKADMKAMNEQLSEANFKAEKQAMQDKMAEDANFKTAMQAMQDQLAAEAEDTAKEEAKHTIELLAMQDKMAAEAAAEAKADLISQHNDLVNAIKGLDASGKPTVTAPVAPVVSQATISNVDAMNAAMSGVVSGPAPGEPGGTGVTGAPQGVAVGKGTPTGGSPGGPGKIICLESHRQGLLDTKIFEADEAWGDIIPKIVLDGYHLWAKPVVRKMRKSRSFSKKVAWLAKPVAKEAAKQMGVGEGSKIGLAMLCVGMPICAILGAAMLPFKQKNTNLILGDK